MFVLYQINHTTGAAHYGPVSRSTQALQTHLQSVEGIDWTEGGSHWGRDNTPEEDEWEWFSGVSPGVLPGYGTTTYTAFIRPIEEIV